MNQDKKDCPPTTFALKIRSKAIFRIILTYALPADLKQGKRCVMLCTCEKTAVYCLWLFHTKTSHRKAPHWDPSQAAAAGPAIESLPKSVQETLHPWPFSHHPLYHRYGKDAPTISSSNPWHMYGLHNTRTYSYCWKLASRNWQVEGKAPSSYNGSRLAC